MLRELYQFEQLHHVRIIWLKADNVGWIGSISLPDLGNLTDAEGLREPKTQRHTKRAVRDEDNDEQEEEEEGEDEYLMKYRTM